MKKFLLSFAAVTIAISGMAVNAEQPRTSAIKAPARSAEAPETNFTATKAQFYHYPDYYKDGSSCYQLVMTNCPSGFSDGGRGTLPNGPGQLLCVFLCGPQSESSSNPAVSYTHLTLPTIA